MRDLASVVTVKEVIAMENKDRIVCVSFNENAYECIVPKAVAVQGNKLAFIQEGSILPENAEWEFLRTRCYSERLQGFLIKPMTMGKKIDGTPCCSGDKVKYEGEICELHWRSSTCSFILEDKFKNPYLIGIFNRNVIEKVEE